MLKNSGKENKKYRCGRKPQSDKEVLVLKATPVLY